LAAVETHHLSDQPLFARSDKRALTGVAGGLSQFLGVNPWVARSGFVIMGLGAGVGVVVYAAGYLASGRPESVPTQPVEVTQSHNIGFILISLGLAAAGTDFFVNNIGSVFSLQTMWLAVLATIVVLTVLVGPWLLRLLNEVNEERRDRIRSEERADISAHLHDSVLNTLALIQRSEANPEVITLARRQERELRAWMQGRLVDENQQLDAAIDALVSRVEGQYNVSVDAVVVGGAIAMDERVNAFVAAVQEATVNAARHSGVKNVSVYVEVEEDRLTGFVRDQGCGFDRQSISSDRRGIVDSIEGRMRRVGGHAAIHTSVDGGTEVELSLPRNSNE
jgi:signal transduction histidine kinase/phage shock protein PspC (stress-responsive transcriptional regulator)